MRAADTNVLVRLVTGDDMRQTAVAEAFVEAGAWVSILALAESAWVLGTIYQRDAAGIADAIEKLLDNKNLILQDSDAVASALELFRAQPALGFADCLILQLARAAGHLPLGTFDRRLAQVEGTHRL